MSGGFPFGPADHKSVTLACTTASGARQFQSEAGQHQTVRLYNAGSDLLYFRFGPAAVVATVPSGATQGDIALPSGQTEVWSTNQPYVAAICPSSTATLHITPGDGE